MLAALRGRPHVWRRDLIDAVTSALIKDELEYGCQSPFVDAVHAVLRGRRRGRLAEGTRLPPLVIDIRRQLAETGLEMGRGTREFEAELNLLEPADLVKSRLLHRLRVLGIVGYQRTGGTDFLRRDDLTRLWESWRCPLEPRIRCHLHRGVAVRNVAAGCRRRPLAGSRRGAPARCGSRGGAAGPVSPGRSRDDVGHAAGPVKRADSRRSPVHGRGHGSRPSVVPVLF